MGRCCETVHGVIWRLIEIDRRTRPRGMISVAFGGCRGGDLCLNPARCDYVALFPPTKFETTPFAGGL